jgi:hypothetical protein
MRMSRGGDFGEVQASNRPWDGNPEEDAAHLGPTQAGTSGRLAGGGHDSGCSHCRSGFGSVQDVADVIDSRMVLRSE